MIMQLFLKRAITHLCSLPNLPAPSSFLLDHLWDWCRTGSCGGSRRRMTCAHIWSSHSVWKSFRCCSWWMLTRAHWWLWRPLCCQCWRPSRLRQARLSGDSTWCSILPSGARDERFVRRLGWLCTDNRKLLPKLD